MQILKKCLHLRGGAAALLMAALTLMTGCGRSDEAARVLLLGTGALSDNDLALSLDAEETENDTIAVYVCGAVASPGVYYLPSGSRACDALERAGGFDEEADREYVNLAGRVEDGQLLKFLTLEETSLVREAAMTGYAGAGQGGEAACVNINLADAERLKTLPGIGEVKARAIIEYRSEHGAFSGIGQIREVEGISESLFEKISDLITV